MSNHTVTVTKIVEIEPFAAPNYAVAVASGTPNMKLAEIPQDLLATMCDEWRARVFEMAGKDDITKEPK